MNRICWKKSGSPHRISKCLTVSGRSRCKSSCKKNTGQLQKWHGRKRWQQHACASASEQGDWRMLIRTMLAASRRSGKMPVPGQVPAGRSQAAALPEWMRINPAAGRMMPGRKQLRAYPECIQRKAAPVQMELTRMLQIRCRKHR